MISSLQPTRPKTQSGHSNIGKPGLGQQLRHHHTTPTGLLSRPRSQIEAMPPHLAPRPAQRPPEGIARQQYNPALTHPVFFSSQWHKPAFPMAALPTASPVAAGYVFAGQPKKDTKL